MPSLVKSPQTLYDKVFQEHIVDERDDGTILLYIGEQCSDDYNRVELTPVTDRHLVHEVTSPVRPSSSNFPRETRIDTQHSKLSRD